MRRPSRRTTALVASIVTVGGLAIAGAASASAGSPATPAPSATVRCSFVPGSDASASPGLQATQSGFECTYFGFSRFVYGAVYTESYTQTYSMNPSTSTSPRPVQYVTSRSGAGSFFVNSAQPQFFGTYVDKVTVTNLLDRSANKSATWYLRAQCGDLSRC